MFKEDMIDSTNKAYKQSDLVNNLFGAVGEELDIVFADLKDNTDQFDFAKMTWAIPILEEWMEFKINSNSPIDSQRSQLMARWRSNGKISIIMLQNIANAWKNGDSIVDFKNGKIYVEFVGEYGQPSDMDSLREALEKAKPAQFSIVYSFKYYTINEVQAMTITNLETKTLDKFAF